jgi:hypothetical protein
MAHLLDLGKLQIAEEGSSRRRLISSACFEEKEDDLVWLIPSLQVACATDMTLYVCGLGTGASWGLRIVES